MLKVVINMECAVHFIYFWEEAILLLASCQIVRNRNNARSFELAGTHFQCS